MLVYIHRQLNGELQMYSRKPKFILEGVYSDTVALLPTTEWLKGMEVLTQLKYGECLPFALTLTLEDITHHE